MEFKIENTKVYGIDAGEVIETGENNSCGKYIIIDYGNNISQKDLDNLVKVINKRKPDIVIFTGNLISKNYKLSIK